MSIATSISDIYFAIDSVKESIEKDQLALSASELKQLVNSDQKLHTLVDSLANKGFMRELPLTLPRSLR